MENKSPIQCKDECGRGDNTIIKHDNAKSTGTQVDIATEFEGRLTLNTFVEIVQHMQFRFGVIRFLLMNTETCQNLEDEIKDTMLGHSLVLSDDKVIQHPVVMGINILRSPDVAKNKIMFADTPDFCLNGIEDDVEDYLIGE